MWIAALIGFAFGFFGSIPVAGPIAAIVLKRGLTGRFRSAALVGLGCAVAEAGYACLAFWGFSTFLARYPLVEKVSQAVAAAILIGLGASFARYRGAKEAAEAGRNDSAWSSLALGFTVTALNPTLIVTWTGATTFLFASRLVTLAPSASIPFSLGALAGISGWFALLTGLLRRYAGRFDRAKLDRVVRGVGWMILALGLWFALRALRYFTGL